MPGEAARRLFADWLDRLIAGQASPEIQLDLIEAAAKRSEPEFREKIKKYESTKRRDDPLVGLIAKYSPGAIENAAGGSSPRGPTSSAFAVTRCVVPGGELTGGEVGPELSGVGARLSRADLLESIVNPNKKIAQGFESVVIATGDGKVHTTTLGRANVRAQKGMTNQCASLLAATPLPYAGQPPRSGTRFRPRRSATVQRRWGVVSSSHVISSGRPGTRGSRLRSGDFAWTGAASIAQGWAGEKLGLLPDFRRPIWCDSLAICAMIPP